MKRMFSNAEKVSEHYLERKREELMNELRDAREIFLVFPVERFQATLEEIIQSDQDNYEKLRNMLHWERDVKAYFQSKEMLLDIFADETIYCSFWDKAEWFFTIAQGTEEELLQLAKDWNETYCGVIFSFEQDGRNDSYQIRRGNIPFEEILRRLTAEEKKELMGAVEQYYEKMFRTEYLNPLRTRDLQEETGNAEIEEIAKGVAGYFNENMGTTTAMRKMVGNCFLRAYWDFVGEDSCHLFRRFYRLFSQELANEYYLYEWLEKEALWKLLLLSAQSETFFEEVEEKLLAEEESTTLPATKCISYYRVKDNPEKTIQQILQESLWLEKDFEGIDLTNVRKSIYDIYRCHLAGTGAEIDFEPKQTSVYYIKGKKFRPYDLTESCLQCCTLFHFSAERLNQFEFSSQTFDESVLQKYGFALSNVSDTIREKYYRRLPLSMKEMLQVIAHYSVSQLTMRYPYLLKMSEWHWIFLLEELMPGSIEILLQGLSKEEA